MKRKWSAKDVGVLSDHARKLRKVQQDYRRKKPASRLKPAIKYSDGLWGAYLYKGEKRMKSVLSFGFFTSRERALEEIQNRRRGLINDDEFIREVYSKPRILHVWKQFTTSLPPITVETNSALYALEKSLRDDMILVDHPSFSSLHWVKPNLAIPWFGLCLKCNLPSHEVSDFICCSTCKFDPHGVHVSCMKQKSSIGKAWTCHKIKGPCYRADLIDARREKALKELNGSKPLCNVSGVIWEDKVQRWRASFTYLGQKYDLGLYEIFDKQKAIKHITEDRDRLKKGMVPRHWERERKRVSRPKNSKPVWKKTVAVDLTLPASLPKSELSSLPARRRSALTSPSPRATVKIRAAQPKRTTTVLLETKICQKVPEPKSKRTTTSLSDIEGGEINEEIKQAEIMSLTEASCMMCGSSDREADFLLCECATPWEHGCHYDCAGLDCIPDTMWTCDVHKTFSNPKDVLRALTAIRINHKSGKITPTQNIDVKEVEEDGTSGNQEELIAENEFYDDAIDASGDKKRRPKFGFKKAMSDIYGSNSQRKLTGRNTMKVQCSICSSPIKIWKETSYYGWWICHTCREENNRKLRKHGKHDILLEKTHADEIPSLEA